MLKPDYIDIDKDGNTTEPMKKAAKERDMKSMGGLLQDDREQYVVGGIASKIASKILKNTDAFAGKKGKITLKDAKDELKNAKEKIQELKDFPDRADELEFYEGVADELEVKIRMIEDDIADEYVARDMVAEGGPMSMDDQMKAALVIPVESEMESEMPMESDDDMEDNYTRFIMEEALSEEEEDMLMSKLEQDEELSMLFDKIIDVAQEFAGSGPVEGPGSGVSDSIPARLSDGEFVFTAKAVEEIGEDTLMSMMKDAEAKADERQGLAMGGSPEENESKSLLSSGVVQEDEIASDELKKRMVQGSSDYVRS
jgi:hypothetical protein